MAPLTRMKKKPDEKKIGMNRGMKESGSERTKKKKKCNKDPASNEKRKEGKGKRKKRRKRKKKMEKEEIYKGRNTHSPPTCTRISEKKIFFRLRISKM